MALAADPKNVFVFSSNFSTTFVTKSKFGLLFEQLFEKSQECRATCGKP